MIVTGVERIPKRRARVQVYVDGIAAIELAAATVRTQGIVPGKIVEQSDLDALVVAEQRCQAMETAAAMLARRPHSEREVRRRLTQRKTESTVIDETLRRLRDVRLLDDAEFARTWAESRDRSSPRGRRLVVQELRTAGVETAVAVEAASAIDDEDAAYRLACGRVRSLARLDYVAFRARLGGFLQRKGFGYGVARATVERCWRENDGDARQADGDVE